MLHGLRTTYEKIWERKSMGTEERLLVAAMGRDEECTGEVRDGESSESSLLYTTILASVKPYKFQHHDALWVVVMSHSCFIIKVDSIGWTVEETMPSEQFS